MFLKAIICFIIKFYQIFVSPLFPAACRHQTTCSENFKCCVDKYGVIVGFYFGFGQVLRCNPWFGKESVI
tara:strand:+ start:576 stop:785 length:210 start_codon:yes stop_codon:yes gene_type:complete